MYLGIDKSLRSIGYDKHGIEVAYLYVCERANCNCVGQWYSGDPDLAVKWKDV